MHKNGAERTRAYRERVKQNEERYAECKRKDRERKKARRSVNSLSKAEAARQRAKCRERVRLHRLKKKQSLSQPNHGHKFAYKTPQALGKAISRVRNALPFSPRKRKAVISKLASTEGVPVGKNIHQTSNKAISSETKRLVEDFFVQDAVSRQAPGMRDYVIVRSNAKKIKLQKRHLLWSLRETFAIFQNDYPDTEIGFSKLYSLRPAMPKNVCLCQYHENIRLLCECLCKVIPAFPQYASTFVDNFVCDSNNEMCMGGKCSKCPALLETIKKESPLDTIVEWYQWERAFMPKSDVVKKDHESAKEKKKMQKLHKEGSVEEAQLSLQKQMPSFLEHVFIKRKQSRFFQDKVLSLQTHEAVVQVDFSENYTCSQQDEIQSAHWNQHQITLFPVAIWSKASFQSHVIISDDRNHDKRSVAVFLDRVLNTFVKKVNPLVREVHLFSDGPSSQFKNKYMVKFLSTLQERSDLKVKWHYFATSHGKGAVDGIGGTVKRVVWGAVSTRKVPVVDSAVSFSSVAKKLCESTEVCLITAKEIEDLSMKTDFSNALPIPGISKIHCVEPGTKGQIKL